MRFVQQVYSAAVLWASFPVDSSTKMGLIGDKKFCDISVSGKSVYHRWRFKQAIHTSISYSFGESNNHG